MKRDTRIVFGVVSAIPLLILAASTICTWAIAAGASPRWRLLFRLTCHGMEERCLWLWGVPMPICARCAAIYGGILAGVFAFAVVPWVRERVMRTFALLALVPLGLDGLSQMTGLRESTNPLRIATGLIAGFAFGLWILSAVERREDREFTTS